MVLKRNHPVALLIHRLRDCFMGSFALTWCLLDSWNFHNLRVRFFLFHHYSLRRNLVNPDTFFLQLFGLHLLPLLFLLLPSLLFFFSLFAVGLLLEHTAILLPSIQNQSRARLAHTDRLSCRCLRVTMLKDELNKPDALLNRKEFTGSLYRLYLRLLPGDFFEVWWAIALYYKSV